MDFDGSTTDLVFRFVAFAGVLVLLAALEILLPKRELLVPKPTRWITNFSIVALDTLVVRVMGAIAAPLVAVGAALYAEANGWGLLNYIMLPVWVEIIIALVFLDFAIWLQHLASHKVPVLWRLHRVHHADRDIDVSTAIRFHPIEIALSMLWKVLLVMMFGFSALSVVLFEVILNSCAMFNHANIALPRWLDSILRLFIVTPDMHRVHHSVLRREHDTNYGFNLSIWDRIFGTYTAQPENGHLGMEVGLKPYLDAKPARLLWCLKLPFLPLSKTD